jgi:hypothetical protein
MAIVELPDELGGISMEHDKRKVFGPQMALGNLPILLRSETSTKVDGQCLAETIEDERALVSREWRVG